MILALDHTCCRCLLRRLVAKGDSIGWNVQYLMVGRASFLATSTMSSATALMTPHVRPGFNPSNIVKPNHRTPRVQHPNHELCHRTDDADAPCGRVQWRVKGTACQKYIC
jgi:hypothetical protein